MYGDKWHSIWEFDYNDEQRYYNGTLETPQGQERILCLANNQVIALGDMVYWETFGVMGRVQRIVHWDRYGGYDVLTIETQRTFIREAMADEVIVMTEGRHGYSIPI